MFRPIKSTNSFLLLLTALSLFNQSILSKANDTIDATQSLTGNQTLVSSGGKFELGFFTPGKSKNWYIGIWYKDVTEKIPVWVANRENPVKNITSGGALRIIRPGILAIVDESDNIIWSSNTSKAARNPIAQLLENGNLVLRDADDDRPENYLWQSFDILTDTLIPYMKFGWDYASGVERYLSSWRSDDDPAPGEYTAHLEPNNYPQVFTRKGSVPTTRLGPWNGAYYSGTINLRKDRTFTFHMNMSRNGVYTMEELTDQSLIARYTLDPSGTAVRSIWVQETQTWVFSMSYPTDNCDTYGLCGAYGTCNLGDSPVCSCLDDKFVPRDPEGWAGLDWSKGCVRRTALNCQAGDGFVKYSNMKLPDARNSWYDEDMTIEECRAECLKNCSCMAYTKLDIIKGSGCLIWIGDLVDMRILSNDGQDIYVRLAASESGSKGGMKKVVAVILPIAGINFLVLSLLICWWKRKNSASKDRIRGTEEEAHNKDIELPFFDLRMILKATNNFSFQNKLGEGGYGSVYKGKLQDGEDIAVKRLSRTSLQGLDELKNEAFCIAKLQHRNLVKLLGYCVQGEEKILIYEYMPNKSLDLILFNENSSELLDWPKRINIVSGIARGLMYLHQDSRLRIIHRDLKASNVLLDKDMNPKISDFGLARIFEGKETAHKTNRVVGTYGYMPPEYAVHGRFSTKSDVFSFGVLLLEIMSGKRNSFFGQENGNINLLGHAWKLYKEGRSLELVDGYVSDSLLPVVLRLIQVGLLCVQQHADDRPCMSLVVAMLDNEISLPEPTQPAFYTEREALAVKGTRESCDVSSTNERTVTILQPR